MEFCGDVLEMVQFVNPIQELKLSSDSWLLLLIYVLLLIKKEPRLYLVFLFTKLLHIFI